MRHRRHGQRADAGHHLLPIMEAPMRGLILATTVLLGVTGTAVAQDHKAQAMTADALKWGPAPPVLPKGGEMAVLAGDPNKAGPFVVRLNHFAFSGGGEVVVQINSE